MLIYESAPFLGLNIACHLPDAIQLSYRIEVIKDIRQAMVLYLESRQQVCLLYCFRDSDFARFF